MTMPLARERLAALLERAATKRVVVIGDAMLDVYLTGDVERISPEAPVPVVRVRHRTYALGGAANVAHNVTAIGAHCSLVCTVGADSAGRQLTEMLRSIEVDHQTWIQVDRPTTQKTRLVARSQQLVRIDEEEDQDLSADDASRVLAAVKAAIEGADAVVLEDYNKGLLVPEVIRAAIRCANERNIPVVVDPKFKNFFEYSGATIFKPNRRELEAALGAEFDVNHADALPATLRRLGVQFLLLTLGESGMVLVSAEGEVSRVNTVARQVYDVVGAGDTVTAYLATMLAAGATAAEAATIANIAAGIEVGKLGAATVTPDEILAF